jgi:hypothetical protein
MTNPIHPDGIIIDITIPEDRVARQDPAFYVGLVEPVATITSADRTRSIAVRCVGDMRVILWKSADCDTDDEENIVTEIFETDDLIWAGITDDEKLAAAEDRMEWENNAWFELFDSAGNGAEFDDVYHEVDEAIQAAIDTLLGA